MAAQAAKKLSDIEADWDRRSLQSAIDAARQVVSGEGINGRAMISSLSELEWGWISAAAVFAWIKTKSQQAVEEGGNYDVPIRTMKADLPPWDAGAVETILPKLGEVSLPWELPLGEWPKETITSFAWQIHQLVGAALALRDEGSSRDHIARRLDTAEREISAANGGPLMTREELMGPLRPNGDFSDDIPF